VRIDVAEARQLACRVLGDSGDRWRHVQVAAHAAIEAAPSVRFEDRDLLVAAVWLHDIGYGLLDEPTGFHPLDGAVFLQEQGWPRRLAALVAHHSEARFAAAARGRLTDLLEFQREEGAVVDALVYADMTAGRDGQRLTLHQRLPDVHRRHAEDPPRVLAARVARDPHLILAAARVDVRLRELGRDFHAALPVSRGLEDFVGMELVATLSPDHPRRGNLDIRGAAHASLSLVQASPQGRVADVDRCARDLLTATLTLPEDGMPVSLLRGKPEPACRTP